MADKKKTTLKAKTPNRNPFSGASDIYLTPNKIAVTRTTTSSAKRGYIKTTRTKYYAQNSANLRKLKAAKGKTVRVGRTGNRYKDI